MNVARLLCGVVSGDSYRKLAALKVVASWLMGDYRLTSQQIDWWHDRDFCAYLRRFGEVDGVNTHRKWSLWQLLRLTAHVEGDTAECGVFEGASSWLICAANEQGLLPKTHHLFDSLQGLSELVALDGSYWSRGDMAKGEALVAANLAPCSDAIAFHKGWIPDRFPEIADRRFSFVHVDVDLYQPTLDSLHFFYERLSPGAVLLCDDYGFSTCPGATRAVDEFLADKVEKMIFLDSGGGAFIKGVPTAVPISPMGRAERGHANSGTSPLGALL